MPILREGELDIMSHSVEQTQRLGARLGSLLRAGDVVCLSGDMGAGKTVFSSGIGQGWGANTPLTSPTFNLVHQHRRTQDKQVLYHLDCYRLSDEGDSVSIGIDDLLDGQGVVILEWAERIKGILPADRLWVELRVREETRRNLMMEAVGQRYQALLEAFRQSAYGF